MQTIDGISKFCPKCHTIKSVADFGYSKDRNDKLTVWCKSCKNLRGRNHYAESEQVRERIADNRKRNMSDPIKHTRQLEVQRKWYAEHYQDDEYRKSELARFKEYDESHAGKERTKRNRATERSHEYQRVYHRTYLKDKYNNDPEYHAKVRDWFAVHNNKKRSNGGQFTVNDWKFLVDLANGKCLKCGQEKKLTIDHIIPVTKDGMTNIWNIQPLCDTCNKSKQTQELDFREMEYRQSVRGYIYSEVT